MSRLPITLRARVAAAVAVVGAVATAAAQTAPAAPGGNADHRALK